MRVVSEVEIERIFQRAKKISYQWLMRRREA